MFQEGMAGGEGRLVPRELGCSADSVGIRALAAADRNVCAPWTAAARWKGFSVVHYLGSCLRHDAGGPPALHSDTCLRYDAGGPPALHSGSCLRHDEGGPPALHSDLRPALYRIQP